MSEATTQPSQIFQTNVPTTSPVINQQNYATMPQNNGVDIFGEVASEPVAQIASYENIHVPLVQTLSESDQSLKSKATGLSVKAAFQRVKDKMYLDLLFENKSSTTFSVRLILFRISQ
jgi:hypothetical protein